MEDPSGTRRFHRVFLGARILSRTGTRLSFLAGILVLAVLLRGPSSMTNQTVSTFDTVSASLSGQSPSYTFCGTLSDASGESSSSGYRADLTLGGVSGPSASSSYRAELRVDKCLLESLVRQRTDPSRFVLDWADYNNDGRVTILDIAQAAFVFDQPSLYWDFDLSGETDITDIARIAFVFEQSLGVSPYPGQGYSEGSMDAAWTAVCGTLPPLEQAYCTARI